MYTPHSFAFSSFFCTSCTGAGGFWVPARAESSVVLLLYMFGVLAEVSDVQNGGLQS